MFTGIIEELGEVVATQVDGDSARLTIRGETVTAGAATGQSIAVNGCCLTVTTLDDGAFTADLMAETLSRTSLGVLRPGDPVNLERALRADGRLDGHVVQGHVDGTGTILERRHEPRWDLVRVSVPARLLRYVAEKGSIAIDGTSLTVVEVRDPGSSAGSEGSLTVSLIPETLARTVLGTKSVGDPVNLEVDVIAKYLERLTSSRATDEAAITTTTEENR